MSAWAQAARRNDGAGVTLFCLPHAGSGAAGFYRWRRLMPEVDVVPILLPGRDARITEAPVAAASLLVEEMHRGLRERLSTQPYAIFGHSMGALLAALWAARIEADGLPQPTHVFLSGRGVPSEMPSIPGLSAMGDEELLRALDRRFGGNSAATLLADETLRAIYLPVLRADLALVDSVTPALFPRQLRSDLLVLRGSEDHATSVDAAGAWRGYTSGAFDSAVLPGGHFFHFGESEAAVLDLVRKKLTITPSNGR